MNGAMGTSIWVVPTMTVEEWYLKYGWDKADFVAKQASDGDLKENPYRGNQIEINFVSEHFEMDLYLKDAAKPWAQSVTSHFQQMTSAVLDLEMLFGASLEESLTKPAKFEDIGGNFVYATEKTQKA